MKKILISAIGIVAICTGSAFATAFSSPSLGGPTGYIGTPNAQIGWDGNDFAIDAGTHYINEDGGPTYVSKVNVSLFRRLELGACYDQQKDVIVNGRSSVENDDDAIAHAKLRFFPWDGGGNSMLAIGFKWMQMEYDQDDEYINKQIYLAATYTGSFFNLPAETTIVFGKTWGENNSNDDIDFSMGFDINLFPSLFQGYLHWVNDFSNYGYTVEPVAADNYYRGVFNTGIRLAILKESKRFKCNLDALMLDALDDNHEWSFGGCFGVSL